MASLDRVWSVASSSLLWLGLLGFGCATGSTKAYGVSSAALTLGQGVESSEAAMRTDRAAAPAGLVGEHCELRLFIEQLPGGRGQYGTRENSLGAAIVERRAQTGELVNGVCLKEPDQPLQLPSTMLIATEEEGPSLDRFCRDEERHELPGPETPVSARLVSPGAPTPTSPPLKARFCVWNGLFHSPRPFTLTLVTAPGARVGDFVEFLRVYRNGDLMAAWNRGSDQPRPELVVVPGSALTSGLLAATHPPHLSEMDIRVIPRTDSVPAGIATEVRNDRQEFTAILREALEAALAVELPAGSPERRSFDCLRLQIEHASRAVMASVAAATVVSPITAPSCTPLIDAGASTPLSDAYTQLKDATRDRVLELKVEAFNRVAEYREKLIAAVPGEKGKLLVQILLRNVSAEDATLIQNCALAIETSGADALCYRELASRPGFPKQNIDDFVRVARSIDRQFSVALRTVDEARALADRLAERVVGISEDTDRQAQIFNALAQSLQDRPSPFEPRRSNPPLLAGEQKLDLSYGDKFQVFAIAPWNAVPLRLDDGLDADFTAGTLVPIIDVFGGRYQWSKSRFADARLAAGVGFVSTEIEETGKTRARWLPNLSIGIGTVKFGAGVVLGGGFDDVGDRMRVLVGADIYKLLAGDNVEVL